jgi:hypothetical protein
MIRLTQRSYTKSKEHPAISIVYTNPCRERERERHTCTAFSGTSPEEIADTTFIIRAATFTVSWNWINF